MFRKTRVHLSWKDVVGAILLSIVIAILVVYRPAFSSGFGQGGVVFLGVLLLSIAALELFRRLDISILRIAAQRMQTQALFSLFQTFSFRAPLPTLGGWAISPDFATVLVSCIRAKRVRTVLDLGSGASTLIAGYALEGVKEGRVIGVDHDKRFAQKTETQISEHGLVATAEVRYAPLTSVALGDSLWQWYDLAELRERGPFDLLIVDGPPDRLQPLSRYPALPVLRKYLSEKASILIDDADQPAEREMIRRWLEEFPEYKVEWVATEKGTAILSRA